MSGYRCALAVLLVPLMAGCAVKPIEYKSNEAMDGPGLFESTLPLSINGQRLEEGSGVNVQKVAHIDEDVVGQCQQLIREFEAFNNFKNLSKGSKEYEEFYLWRVWRDQESSSAER